MVNDENFELLLVHRKSRNFIQCNDAVRINLSHEVGLLHTSLSRIMRSELVGMYVRVPRSALSYSRGWCRVIAFRVRFVCSSFLSLMNLYLS